MTAGDRPDGLVGALLRLLAELDERDRRSPQSRDPTDRITLHSSVSVSELDDAIDNARPTSLVVTTRTIEGGLCVVADLPGVSQADVSVDLGRAGRSLTITADGDFVGEVLLDEVFRSVDDVSFNNEVLEVRLLHD